jgi:hypothetical protein
MEVPIAVSITGTRSGELQASLQYAWAWCQWPEGVKASRRLVASLGVVAPGQTSDVGGDDLDTVMEQLTSLVTLTALEERAGELLMLHANGLADTVSGRTVVMVGPSEAGKTTAALTLCPGRSYVTDECLAMDKSGNVVPYPKPLSVRKEGRREQVMPGSVGALPPPDECRVVRVLFLGRDAEHLGEPVLRHVPRLEAMSTAASETSYLAKLRDPLHRLANLFEPEGDALMVTYRDATQLDDLVTSLLQSRDG